MYELDVKHSQPAGEFQFPVQLCKVITSTPPVINTVETCVQMVFKRDIVRWLVFCTDVQMMCVF